MSFIISRYAKSYFITCFCRHQDNCSYAAVSAQPRDKNRSKYCSEQQRMILYPMVVNRFGVFKHVETFSQLQTTALKCRDVAFQIKNELATYHQIYLLTKIHNKLLAHSKKQKKFHELTIN